LANYAVSLLGRELIRAASCDGKIMIHDDEVLREFLVESHENLDQLDRDFLALEREPSAHERIASIFRTIHTLKGTAGFFGFSQLEGLAHAGENLLVMLRDGIVSLTPEITSALLALVDRVRALLQIIEQTGKEGHVPCEDILERLAGLKLGSLAPPTHAQNPREQNSHTAVLFTPVPRLDRTDSARQPPAPEAAPPAPQPSPAAPPPRRTSGPPAALNAGKPLQAPAPAPAPAPAAAAVTESSVRVDVGLLDQLMNLVGELVLARNQMAQFGARIEDPGFVTASQRLNHITSELQQHVMKTRMQPIGNVWTKLPRVVRDLAVTCGKQIRIEMIGKETELDRTILESIKDPLTHIVRNAVDHGIEAPDLRAAQGKPRTGTLTLKAFHEGGQVNIEVSDDGAGLNLAAIRRKAVERQLISEERALGLSQHELVQLVFLPGFSTAAQITNVSGRGVGMDVVKTNIEKIGGTVDLASTAGVGSTLRIKIPLTLAIVPALMVASAGQRYAIPQVNLLELVRLEGDLARKGVEKIHGAPVYRLRGRLLPLVFLNDQFGCARARDTDPETDGVNIVVLQADDRQFGLVVDDVRDTEEIVVKPLGKELKGLSLFQGATIMGDGRVALILDILGLAQHAGAVARGAATGRLGPQHTDPGDRNALVAEQQHQALLLFSVGEDGVMALPLSMVARIEEFPRERLERAGKRRVIQYRSEILPLIELSEALGEEEQVNGDSLHVIVYSEQGRSVGFVVRRILDIVEDSVQLERCTAQRGVLGAAVIQGKVVDVLDVEGVIRAQHPAFFQGRAA
jgi:two-component system chemotaxis sensor kinase CheA